MPDAFARAQRAAATAQILALVAFIALVATLSVNFGFAVFETLRAMPGAPFGEKLRALAPLLVAILPAILFISALARLRVALRIYGEGEFFSPRAARAVRRAGEEAVLALAAQIVIAPTLASWIGGDGRVRINLELTDLALAAFVVFVAALGRVLDLAAAIKAENDQIV